MSKAKSPRKPSAAAPAPVFPAPDHDHDQCSTDAMAVAEALCAERGQRLTPIRRKVLGTLLASHKPLGAYEIIDQLAPRPEPRLPRARVSPPERPGASDREPQRLHCLRPQSCRRRAGGVPDLR